MAKIIVTYRLEDSRYDNLSKFHIMSKGDYNLNNYDEFEDALEIIYNKARELGYYLKVSGGDDSVDLEITESFNIEDEDKAKEISNKILAIGEQNLAWLRC